MTKDPGKKFIIRPAEGSDAEVVAASDLEIWGAWAYPHTLYRQLFDLYQSTSFIAETSDGTYAGCAVGLVKPKAAWILSVDIPLRFRGYGLGRELLTKLLEAFRQFDIEQVTAIIDPSNLASHKLFASFKFKRIGVEKDYFGKGKDQEKWVLTEGFV